MPEEDAPNAARPIRGSRHFHLIDSRIGHPRGYRDEIFPARQAAEAAARARAHWLAGVAGLRVERLAGRGRYLVTGGSPGDAGRIIEVEGCDDPECMQLDYGSIC